MHLQIHRVIDKFLQVFLNVFCDGFFGTQLVLIELFFGVIKTAIDVTTSEKWKGNL